MIRRSCFLSAEISWCQTKHNHIVHTYTLGHSKGTLSQCNMAREHLNFCWEHMGWYSLVGSGWYRSLVVLGKGALIKFYAVTNIEGDIIFRIYDYSIHNPVLRRLCSLIPHPLHCSSDRGRLEQQGRVTLVLWWILHIHTSQMWPYIYLLMTQYNACTKMKSTHVFTRSE